jgi:plasmid stabilization system protein ParE
MKYSIEISSVAETEADGAFLRLSQVTSPTKASQWYSGLLKAIESLSQMPKRCFTILEGKDMSTIRILHIRHTSQQTIGEELDDEQPDAT